jgi:hypothetical protein
VSVTACPSRLLAEEPELEELLAWYVESSPWAGMSAVPSGPPQWPYPGGYLNQPARLVAAVQRIRAELAHLDETEAKES